MHKKLKYNIGLESVFSTWKIERFVGKKNRRCICKCTVCGKKKEFDKYKLIYGIYAPCKACNGFIKQSKDKVKDSWNTALNGVYHEGLNIDSRYWFTCSKGHNYKTTIKNFNGICPSCDAHIGNDNQLDELINVITGTLRAFNLGHLMALENYISVDKIKVLISIKRKNRNKFIKKHFLSEKHFLSTIIKEKNLEKSYLDRGYYLLEIEFENNYLENISNVKDALIKILSKT